MSKDIYSMDMSFNFLLQATRVLSIDNYDEDELKMVYEFMVGLDNDILNDYDFFCSHFTFGCD